MKATLTTILAHSEHILGRSDTAVEKFNECLAERDDPLTSLLQQGASLVNAGARIRVWREVQTTVDLGVERATPDDRILGDLLELVLENVIGGRRDPMRQSTNPFQNLSDLAERSAWGEVHRYLLLGRE